MNLRKAESGAAGAVVTVGLIAVLVGGGIGYAVGNNKNDKSNDSVASVSENEPNSSTKAADLRVTLNQIMRQHVALASVALKDAASGSPDAAEAVKALDANSVELADAVGSVYGDDARESFLTLWRNHIGFFVDYTNGAVAEDEAKMAQAKQDIAGYTEEASAFFSGANPNIEKEAFKAGLQTHGDQVFAIVDAYAAKDYAKAFATEEEAYNHIGTAADNLAAAIVKQNPDKF